MHEGLKTYTPKNRLLHTQGHHGSPVSPYITKTLEYSSPSPTSHGHQRMNTEPSISSSNNYESKNNDTLHLAGSRRRESSWNKRQFAEIMQKCKDLKRMYSHKEQDHKQLMAKYGMLELQLRHLKSINEEQFNKFEEALQMKEEHIHRLYQESTATAAKYAHELGSLKSEMKSLMQEKNACVEELEAYHKKCSNLSASYQQALRENNQLKKEIEVMTKTYYKDPEEYDHRVLSRLSPNERQLMDKLKQLQQVVINYSKKLESVESVNSRAILDKDIEIKSLTEKFQKYSTISENEIHNLKVTLKRQERDHQESLARCVKEAEKNAQAKAIGKFQSKINALADLKFKNQSLQDTISQDKALIQKLEAEVMQLSFRADQSNAESTAKNQAQVSKLEKENADLLEEKKEVLRNYQNTYDQVTKLKEQMELAYKQYSQENGKLREQLEKERLRADQYDAIAQQGRQIVEKMEKLLEEKNQELLQFKKQLLDTIEAYTKARSLFVEASVQVDIPQSNKNASTSPFKIEPKAIVIAESKAGMSPEPERPASISSSPNLKPSTSDPASPPKSKSEIVASLKNLAAIPPFKKGGSGSGSSSNPSTPSPKKTNYTPAVVYKEQPQHES